MNTVIVKGGAFYDSVFVSTPSVYRATPAYLGWEDRVKGGRHTIEVRRPGYSDWLRTDVEVPVDECHSGPGAGHRTCDVVTRDGCALAPTIRSQSMNATSPNRTGMVTVSTTLPYSGHIRPVELIRR